MSNPETVIAGKTALHRSPFGTVSFTDTKGNRVTIDSTEADKLFEAIRDGSGELLPTLHAEGTQKAANLFVGGKRNIYADDSCVIANW